MVNSQSTNKMQKIDCDLSINSDSVGRKFCRQQRTMFCRTNLLFFLLCDINERALWRQNSLLFSESFFRYEIKEWFAKLVFNLCCSRNATMKLKSKEESTCKEAEERFEEISFFSILWEMTSVTPKVNDFRATLPCKKMKSYWRRNVVLLRPCFVCDLVVTLLMVMLSNRADHVNQVERWYCLATRYNYSMSPVLIKLCIIC